MKKTRKYLLCLQVILYLTAGLFGGYFQLTTSRRGRPSTILITLMTGVFQLTTSRRGRRGQGSGQHDRSCISTHYLTQR